MSSNSSTGQILGTIVGAVIGYFIPGSYVAIGAALGGAIGGALDPPKGPQIVGPRLSDLSQQGTGYGSAIPRVYGSVALLGNIFWIENNQLKEVSKTKRSGGKGGGGGSSQTTYAYYATFALGLCEGPIAGIRRIWVNGNLIYDAGAGDIETIMASNKAASGFTLYTGTESQMPDPRMQATLGVANTPAYRGLAYLVFEDFALKDYGNSLMGSQIKVEVLSSLSTSILSQTVSCAYTQPHSTPAFSAQPVYVGLDNVTIGVPQWDSAYPATSSCPLFDVYPNGVIVNELAPSCPGTQVMPNQQLSKGKFLYSGLQVFTAWTFDGPHGFIAEAEGLYAGISNLDAGIYISQGSPGTQIKIPLGTGDCAITTDGEFIWVVGTTQSRKFDKYLQLLQTGVGLGGMAMGSSRLWFDPASGALYCIPDGLGIDVYRFAPDLSSVALFAGGLSMPGDTYYNLGLFVYNDIIIIAKPGSASSGKTATIGYFVRNAVTQTSVSLGSIVAAEIQKSGLLSLSDIDTSTLTDPVRGYRLSQVAALRAGIEPLQGAWPFDVFQSGYAIRFKRRGTGGSVATLDATLFDARDAGDQPGVGLSQSREMDTQLPWRVEINHIDFTREYDVNTQYAERLNTASIHLNKIDMAVVMTPDEAAQKAEILLYLYWLERHDLAFKLPPSYAYLEPADIITVTVPSGVYTLRLTQIQYNPNGVLECQAKFHRAAVYTSTALGVTSGAQPPTTIAYPGPLVLELLDIPLLKPAYDDPGLHVALCAANGSWAGASLWKSIDGGQTWDPSNAFIESGCIGFAKNALGTPAYFGLMDKSSVLGVRLFGGALSSVSQIQLLAGANHFAYGADGRWEIVAAQTCVLQGDGSYWLSDFLRGRFGTEAAASRHVAGDRIVALSEDQVQIAALSSAHIGALLAYRAVVTGDDVMAASTREFKYTGVNLKPLSPVYLAGSVTPGTNDWAITWVRRTRLNGEWSDGVDAGLGEASESYDVEIYSDITYQTLKRTFSGLSSAACTYTSAQQVADFGANQTQLYLKVYQNSAMVGRGTPLARLLPFTDGTIILLHCEGKNGANVFKDEMGKSITPGGTVNTADDVAPAFGKTAAKFDGAGYLIWPSGLPSLNDFTLEWRHYGSLAWCIWSIDANNYLYNNQLVLNGVGMASMSWSNGSNWCHVAIVRLAGVLTVYKDGAVVYQTNHAPSVNFSSLYWGMYKPNNNLFMTARLDEIRLTNWARYTGPFSSPNSEFTIQQGAW